MLSHTPWAQRTCMHESGIWIGDLPKSEQSEHQSGAEGSGGRAGTYHSSPALSDGGGSVKIGDVIKGMDKSLELLCQRYYRSLQVLDR